MSISTKTIPGRLLSLDALRGLDMLFLVGISGVFQALGKSYDNAFLIYWQTNVNILNGMVFIHMI